MACSLEKIASQFAIEGRFLKSEAITNGLINVTHVVSCELPSEGIRRYILQRINAQVFSEPLKVMHNVATVTQHLASQQNEARNQPAARSLQLIETANGESSLKNYDGSLWRCFDYLEGCISFDTCADEKVAFEAARGFGAFLQQVEDIPSQQLHETIIDFHHTQKRYQRLIEVIADDPCQRVSLVSDEIDFIQEREVLCSILTKQIEDRSIPVRVTHNDTKVNNIMFDKQSHEAVCVIDLDTVMPGAAAYDFGDLVRTTISDHQEDTLNLSSVRVRPHYFEALAKGFLHDCPSLTENEILSLANAANVITLEVAIRFLTDFLEGDIYFQTDRDMHNLDRCRTQLKLLEQLEAHAEEFTKIVQLLKTDVSK